NDLGIKKDEKVLLLMQNSPQFIIGFFAILRIQAVIVPINPMSTTADLTFFVNYCSIKAGLVSQELLNNVTPLKKDTSLEHIIVATYSDYISAKDALDELPSDVTAPAKSDSNDISWETALRAGSTPSHYQGKADDIAM